MTNRNDNSGAKIKSSILPEIVTTVSPSNAFGDIDFNDVKLIFDNKR